MHLIIIHPANFSHTLEYQSYLINISLSGIDITKPNKVLRWIINLYPPSSQCVGTDMVYYVYLLSKGTVPT
jgi:hypothetical protein